MRTMRKLAELINYTGQERHIRELAISDRIVPIEKVAVMSLEEICSLIQERYEIISYTDENIYIVKKENLKYLKTMLVDISR